MHDPRAVGGRNSGGLVAGAVVDNNDLDLAVTALRRKGIDTGADSLPLVTGWDDKGNVGQEITHVRVIASRACPSSSPSLGPISHSRILPQCLRLLLRGRALPARCSTNLRRHEPRQRTARTRRTE